MSNTILSAPPNRQRRQEEQSDRFVHHEYEHSLVRRMNRWKRKHRFSWSLRRLFAESRLAARNA